MGGIGIDSALKVGFMLCAFLRRYHAVVQEFRLGCHPLSEVSLQTVSNQCVNYDKDSFLGPVGKDGKVARTPLANAAGAALGEGENAYETLAAMSFNYHFVRSKKALMEDKGKCMFCHDTACNTDSRDCPILKKLSFKMEKRSDLDNANAASRVTAPPTLVSAKPAPAPAPSLDNTSGSGSLPGCFSASAESDSYDLGDDYNSKGKLTGSMYLGTSLGKPNPSSCAYLSPSCSPLAATTIHLTTPSSIQKWGATSATTLHQMTQPLHKLWGGVTSRCMITCFHALPMTLKASRQSIF
jgi:hypothetical protein